MGRSKTVTNPHFFLSFSLGSRRARKLDQNPCGPALMNAADFLNHPHYVCLLFPSPRFLYFFIFTPHDIATSMRAP